MSIKEDRILDDGGTHVYSASETQRRNSNTKSSLEQRLERRIEELESQARKKDQGPRTKLHMDQGQKRQYNSTENYQHPCVKCKDLSGSEEEKKDICTNLSHCRYHDGEYKCTKSAKCKERTANESALKDYKRERIPKKATIRQVKEIMKFTDEDLEAITEEDLQQPCTRGQRCPKENFGLHSRACKVEMEGQSLRPLGQSWDDLVQEQEAFNGNRS